MIKRTPSAIEFGAMFAVAKAAASPFMAVHAIDGTQSRTADLIAAVGLLPNLDSFAELLGERQEVMEQIMSSPGPKTILAPTDQFAAKIVDKDSDSKDDEAEDISSAILYHVLKCSFPLDGVTLFPMHTIGHSLLTTQHHARLPGGNGQAIALSRDSAVTTATLQVSEATDDILVAPSSDASLPLTSGDFTVLPIRGALSLPRNATATMRDVLGAEAFVDFLPTLHRLSTRNEARHCLFRRTVLWPPSTPRIRGPTLVTPKHR